MSPVRVTWARTMGYCRSLYSTSAIVAGFLAAVEISFCFALEKAEGSALSLASVWTTSVAPWLPALAAFLGMDAWSDERRSGRVALLLSAPVQERDLTFGKFFGVWTLLALSLVGCLAVSLLTLFIHAPQAVRDVSVFPFAAGLAILLVQGALWCAVSVMMSGFFRHAAGAVAATLALLVAAPRCLWFALTVWTSAGQPTFGIPPLEAHVLDAVGGSVSSATLVSYLVLTVLSLFVASKTVALYRLVGRGAGRSRAGVGFSVFLAFLLAGLVIALAMRLDIAVELPIGAQGVRLSQRTRGILADNRDELFVTCFLSRSHASYRPTVHFLRALSSQAKELGGARLLVRYVDPNWDFSATERLARLGEKPGTIVFERGRRHVAVGIGTLPSERDCATAILSLVAPPSRRNVYWTSGHGEYDWTAYGPRGMSDIARELARDGYSNQSIGITGVAKIPRDCALVIVAGARDEFSRAELDSVEAYLRQGGRLLVLQGAAEGGGVSSLLPAWGIRPTAASVAGLPTLSGTDVILSEFADHAVTAPLAGSRIVLDRPVAFEPSAAVENGAGADRLDYVPLAHGRGVTFSAAIERGAETGRDLALRPTRIVTIGDASFVLNAPLQQRGNANRDFFLNSVAWLSGTDAAVSAGTDTAVLSSGMDRASRVRFFIDAGIGAPAATLLLLFLATWIGRRRS